jgi:hypothetical protein
MEDPPEKSPSTPGPESVPTEADIQEEAPGVPDKGEGEPPPESIPGDGGEVPNPKD